MLLMAVLNTVMHMGVIRCIFVIKVCKLLNLSTLILFPLLLSTFIAVNIRKMIVDQGRSQPIG